MGSPKNTPATAAISPAAISVSGSGSHGAQQQVVAGESADRHERGAAERDQAGVAHQQVQANAGKSHRDRWDQDRVDPVFVAERRQQQQRGGAKPDQRTLRRKPKSPGRGKARQSCG